MPTTTLLCPYCSALFRTPPPVSDVPVAAICQRCGGTTMYRDGALGVPTSEEMAAFAGHDEWVRMSGEALGVREWYMRDRSTLEDLALAVLLTTGTEGPTVDGIRCRSLTAGETAIRIADAVLRAGYHTHPGQDDADD